MKEEWRSVWTRAGVPCVTKALINMMLQQSANFWDTLNLVCELHLSSTLNLAVTCAWSVNNKKMEG